MTEEQKIKTYYKPKSKVYRQAVPSNHQDQRDIRAQKRTEQTPRPSLGSDVGRSIGNFINRGISNFKENAGRSQIRDTPPRERMPRQHAPEQHPRRERSPFDTGGFQMGNFEGGFGGGLDLSGHPDPMVSGNFGRERPERVVRKKKPGNVTEIHYHYH